MNKYKDYETEKEEDENDEKEIEEELKEEPANKKQKVAFEETNNLSESSVDENNYESDTNSEITTESNKANAKFECKCGKKYVNKKNFEKHLLRSEHKERDKNWLGYYL